MIELTVLRVVDEGGAVDGVFDLEYVGGGAVWYLIRLVERIKSIIVASLLVDSSQSFPSLYLGRSFAHSPVVDDDRTF